jgi:hypothetical protein
MIAHRTNTTENEVILMFDTILEVTDRPLITGRSPFVTMKRMQNSVSTVTSTVIPEITKLTITKKPLVTNSPTAILLPSSAVITNKDVFSEIPSTVSKTASSDKQLKIQILH